MKSIPFILCLAMLIVSCKQDAPTPKPTTYYSVTMNYGAGGTATIKGSTNLQSVLAGTTISIIAIPESNYVTIVTINGSVVTLVNNTTTFVVNQNATIVVTFKSLMYQINVDTTGLGTFGTVSPVNDSIISGKTATINVTPTAGCRVASIIGNVPFTTNTDSTVITVLNVTSNLNFKVRLTDSLRLSQWQSLNNLLVGSWLFTKIETSYPNNPIVGLQQWVNSPINSCAADDYESFSIDGVYQYHTNGTFCPGETQDIRVQCKWLLSMNGQKIALMYTDNTTDTLALNKLTQDSLIFTASQYSGWNQLNTRVSHVRK